MTWPIYSEACRRDVDDLLKRGGSLSAYKANPKVGAGPSEGSWAWRLERAIEEKFKVKHAVLTNSGTAGLHAGLAALRLRPGSEVITSPYTFSATAAAILHAGYVPCFADVDPYTFCITKETVSAAIRGRERSVKAIVPVSLFGGLCDTDGLSQFGVPVIEDACQAVGARAGSRYSGAAPSLAGAYSFNGGKNIPAGECGALVTDDGELAEKARLLANHGENFGTRGDALPLGVGYNYRPNEVTCAIAWHGLQELEERNRKRKLFASTVQHLGPFLPPELMSDKPYLHPGCLDFRSHVFYVYPFTVHGTVRDGFIERLKSKGVNCGGGYITPPLHHYPAFRKYATRELPNVDELSFKTLCLLYDVYHEEPQKEAKRVAQAMREALCE